MLKLETSPSIRSDRTKVEGWRDWSIGRLIGDSMESMDCGASNRCIQLWHPVVNRLQTVQCPQPLRTEPVNGLWETNAICGIALVKVRDVRGCTKQGLQWCQCQAQRLEGAKYESLFMCTGIMWAEAWGFRHWAILSTWLLWGAWQGGQERSLPLHSNHSTFFPQKRNQYCLNTSLAFFPSLSTWRSDFFSQKFGILAKEKLRCGCRRGWRFGSGTMKLMSNQLNVTCVQDGHFEHPWPWCRRGPCWFLARCRGAVLAAGLFGNSPLDVEIWLRHWFVFSEKLSLDCRFAVILASFTEGGILESIPCHHVVMPESANGGCSWCPGLTQKAREKRVLDCGNNDRLYIKMILYVCIKTHTQRNTWSQREKRLHSLKRICFWKISRKIIQNSSKFTDLQI